MAPQSFPQPVHADLDTHHIEGFVHQFGAHVTIPLVSHIVDNLWTGGCIDGVELPEDFQYVISLYRWERYAIPQWTQRIEVEMYDSGKMPDVPMVNGLGLMVANLMPNHTSEANGNILVHCQAGLNRSSLIAATALLHRGYTAREAIDLLREKRSPAVLCNTTFESWLLNHDKSLP